MACNSTFFSLPFASTRESVSWLKDVIDLGDMDFGYSDSDDATEVVVEDNNLIKVVAVVILVMVALVGNSLVIFSVFCNKAMR